MQKLLSLTAILFPIVGMIIKALLNFYPSYPGNQSGIIHIEERTKIEMCLVNFHNVTIIENKELSEQFYPPTYACR